MATGWTLTEINPSKLKNHVVSIEIYSTQPIDAEFLESIKDGVREPIRVTKDDVILSGHRRRQHAIAAKLKSVPILRARHAISDPEQVIEIVESNKHREKTVEQKAREFAKLAEAKAVIKAAEKAKNLKKGPESPNGQNCPLGEPGRAKDEAAEQVGMSRHTAEKAAAVVEKIDELSEEGREEEAQELRQTLNEGNVSAAARKAGVAPPKKPKTAAAVQRNGKASIAAPPYDAKAIEKQFGALTRAIDDMARVCGLNNSPGHKQCVGHLSKAFDGFRAFVKECDAVQSRKARSA